MTVSDTTIVADGLGDIFKNLCKKRNNSSKKMQKNVIKNLGRALEIRENVGTAFASRSPIAGSSSLPEVIKFYHTGKGLYLGKFVYYLKFPVSVAINDYTYIKVLSICTIGKR